MESTAAQSRPPLWLWAGWAATNRRAACLRCPTRLSQKDQLTCWDWDWEKQRTDPVPCMTPCGSPAGRCHCRHRVWTSSTPAGSLLLAVRCRCRADCSQPRDGLPPPWSSLPHNPGEKRQPPPLPHRETAVLLWAAKRSPPWCTTHGLFAMSASMSSTRSSLGNLLRNKQWKRRCSPVPWGRGASILMRSLGGERRQVEVLLHQLEVHQLVRMQPTGGNGALCRSSTGVAQPPLGRR